LKGHHQERITGEVEDAEKKIFLEILELRLLCVSG
jgi:hypothetical protein